MGNKSASVNALLMCLREDIGIENFDITDLMCSTLYGLFNSHFSMRVFQSLSDSGNQYQNEIADS